jgi:hypothetical protein
MSRRGEPAIRSPSSRLDQGDAPFGFQVLAQTIEVGDSTVDVMVHVAEEDEVDLASGEAGIVGLGEHHLDIFVTTGVELLAQLVDDVPVDVDGIDPALGSDGIGQTKGEVPAAGTDVGNLVSGMQLEGREDAVGKLPARPPRELSVVEPGQNRREDRAEDHDRES